jgi:hypothetical protein
MVGEQCQRCERLEEVADLATPRVDLHGVQTTWLVYVSIFSKAYWASSRRPARAKSVIRGTGFLAVMRFHDCAPTSAGPNGSPAPYTGAAC